MWLFNIIYPIFIQLVILIFYSTIFEKRVFKGKMFLSSQTTANMLFYRT